MEGKGQKEVERKVRRGRREEGKRQEVERKVRARRR